MFGESASFSSLSSPAVSGYDIFYVHDYANFELSGLLDTPWDEPTDRSPEFSRYLSGEIFIENPWNRLGDDAICEPCFH